MTPWSYKSTLSTSIEEFRSLSKPESSYINRVALVPDDDKDCNYQDVLLYTFSWLDRLEKFLNANGDKIDLEAFYLLLATVKDLQKAPPIRTAAQRHRLLVPLRSMMLWLPTRFLPRMKRDPGKLLLMAYIYGISLILSPIFANLGAAYFRYMSVAPVQAIYDHLRTLSEYAEAKDPHTEALQLMEFPMAAVWNFRSRMGLHLDDCRIPAVLQLVTIGIGECYESTTIMASKIDE